MRGGEPVRIDAAAPTVDRVRRVGEDDEEGVDTLRVRLTAEQVRAFMQRARTMVASGRPACPFCSQPLDPTGHICPRANGYRRQS